MQCRVGSPKTRFPVLSCVEVIEVHFFRFPAKRNILMLICAFFRGVLYDLLQNYYLRSRLSI